MASVLTSNDPATLILTKGKDCLRLHNYMQLILKKEALRQLHLLLTLNSQETI
uniref:Uncharacterized protein MANES_01G043900 n=1 Tax=Rhizophora mucronata TaxID=61149 RepID=A0A2P2ME84_RHIMU